ncbi:MAG: ABC transporter ATP-binding protein [Myxococcales bacterium]|nr:MAG: ABC transporter ATP-binding protein [Myxococcales bacterium]
MNEDKTSPSLRAIRLSKWYGRITALQQISVDLEPGIWGLLGPNGSGKSTFLKLCAGLLRPSLGQMHVNGMAPFANPKVLKDIGLCPEADALPKELSALEFVAAMARLSGFSKKESLERAKAALERMGLTEAADRRLVGFSRGMRQRVKLAQAMVHEPSILLLDEPLSGTDPTTRQMILAEIQAHADRGGLVLFSTHVLHEVESLTDKVLLIARGQLVAQGAIREIRDLLDDVPHQIWVECSETRKLAQSMIAEEHIKRIDFHDASRVVFETDAPDQSYTALGQKLSEHDYGLVALSSPDAQLESLFHRLVERSSGLAGVGVDAASKKQNKARKEAADA